MLMKYTERLTDPGVDPSVRSVGVSHNNALAETVIGLFKTEVIHAVDLGAASRPSNGSTSSTIGVSSSPLESSRQPKLKTASMHETIRSLWCHGSNQMASGKPGAVQTLHLLGIPTVERFGIDNTESCHEEICFSSF